MSAVSQCRDVRAQVDPAPCSHGGGLVMTVKKTASVVFGYYALG